MAKYITILIFLFAGCKAAKDQRAVGRVLGDEDLSNQVFKALEKTRPCINDTITETLPGIERVVSDTIYDFIEVPVEKTDTLEITTAGKIKVMYVNKTIYKTDTLVKTVEDVRRLNLVTKERYQLLGKVEQLDKDRKEERKNAKKWFWLFLGVVTLSLVLTFLKFKKQLLGKK